MKKLYGNNLAKVMDDANYIAPTIAPINATAPKFGGGRLSLQ